MYKTKDFEKITSLILLHFNSVISIILFGSYARGSATKNSDMDFFVLTKKKYSRIEKLKKLTDLRWNIADLGYNADVIIKSNAEFLLEKNIPSLSKVIDTEGKIVWTKI